MIKKIFIFIGLFIVLLANTFAFDANLSVNNNSVNINDTFKLRLKLDSTEGGKFKVSDIKGMQNFKKLGQSQSQSSSTQIVVVNGKTKQEAKTTINLDLTLKPLKNGEFEIGPATISDGKKEYKTNSVKIKVDGTNIGIINNSIGKTNSQNIQNTKNIINNSNNNIKKSSNNPDLNQLNNLNKEHVSNNNYDLYLLVLVLFLTSVVFYILIKDKKKLNNIVNIKKEQETKKENIDNEEKQENKEIDFEERPKKIKYPKVSDEDFIDKIDEIFRNKIKQKENIDNVSSLTLEEIGEKTGNKQNILEIIELLNKAKYSNNITDNNKLLELVIIFN